MATTPVQAIGPQAGSQPIDPIAEAGEWWQEGLRTRFGAARVDGAIKPNLVAQAAYQSMIAPTASGVPLRELPPDVAQEILDSRNEAMKEFFDGWSESIRKNAEAGKKAAFAAMLKQRRLLALGQARLLVAGRTPSSPNPGSANREPPQNQPGGVGLAAASTLAAAGVSGAFERGNLVAGGIGLRGCRNG